MENYTEEELKYLNILSAHSNVMTNNNLNDIIKNTDFQYEFLLDNHNFISKDEFFYINNMPSTRYNLNKTTLQTFSVTLAGSIIFFLAMPNSRRYSNIFILNSFLFSVSTSFFYFFYNNNKISNNIENIFIKGYHNKLKYLKYK